MRVTDQRHFCVSAILVKGNDFLVEKRRLGDTDPGLIVLPGGHVEKSESLERALKREILEELELEVVEMSSVFVANHTASDGEKQRVHYFLIKDWQGSPTSHEAESVKWTSDVSVLSLDHERKAVSKALSQRSRRTISHSSTSS